MPCVATGAILSGQQGWRRPLVQHFNFFKIYKLFVSKQLSNFHPHINFKIFFIINSKFIKQSTQN